MVAFDHHLGSGHKGPFKIILILLPDSSKFYFLGLLNSWTSLTAFSHMFQWHCYCMSVSCIPGSLNYGHRRHYPIGKCRCDNWNGFFFITAHSQEPTLLAIQRTELSTSMLFLWKTVFLRSEANDSEAIIQNTTHLFQVEDCRWNVHHFIPCF